MGPPDAELSRASAEEDQCFSVRFALKSSPASSDISHEVDFTCVHVLACTLLMLNLWVAIICSIYRTAVIFFFAWEAVAWALIHVTQCFHNYPRKARILIF
jgi:hypothetical protein